MWIVLLILIVVIVVIVAAIMSGKKARRRYQSLGAISIFAAEHFEGLPIPTNLSATLVACPDKVLIESKRGNFDIPNERIIRYSKEVLRQSQAMTPMFVIHYHDKTGEKQTISFVSKVFDIDKLVVDFSKALNRPENNFEAGPEGTISL